MKIDHLPLLSNRHRYIAAALLLACMGLAAWNGVRWLLVPLALCGVILASWPRKGR